jgi:hypothetical protein
VGEKKKIEKICKNRQAGQWFDPVGQSTPGQRRAFGPSVLLATLQCAGCIARQTQRVLIGNWQLAIFQFIGDRPGEEWAMKLTNSPICS